MRAAHRSAFLCAAVACAASLLSAQYPPETRRRQLDTPHDEVIFPQELQAYAQRVANRLEALSKPLAQTLDAVGRVGPQLYRSAGVEAAFDFGVLHFTENLRAGVRCSHAFDPVQPFLGYSW